MKYAESAPPIEPDAMAITVRTKYVTEHSKPEALHHVFVYHITIENVGTETARLFWRHWLIHDQMAGNHEVEGEGVVGESPLLAPGEMHRYQSFCVLRGPVGYMEGFYHFRRLDGSVFRVPIPRFHLHGLPDKLDSVVN